MNNHISPHIIEHKKKTTRFGFGNPGPDLDKRKHVEVLNLLKIKKPAQIHFHHTLPYKRQ